MTKLLQFILFLGLATNIMSQIPNGFSYQAVVRDGDQSLLRNQFVNVEASILRGASKEVVFTQTLDTKTNENGLISITIGQTDEFAEIDWTTGQFYIQTRIDPSGGRNYTIETVTQLLSVPYAMAAQMAVNVLSAPEIDLSGYATIEQFDFLLGKITDLENQIEASNNETAEQIELLNERITELEEEVDELKNMVYELYYPIEIPFEEYSLGETQCKWTNLNYDNTVVIIRTNNELVNYISCPTGWNYQEIDFSKKTLFLANGTSSSGIKSISPKKLLQISPKFYEFEVEITQNNFAVVEQWQVAVLIDKIDGVNEIDLKISEIQEVSIVNTNLKLLGIVDEETGNLTELITYSSQYCTTYTLKFTSDSTFRGKGDCNDLWGKCEIDYTTNSIDFFELGGTFAGCHPDSDEGLYKELLRSVYYFSLQDNKLILYFDEQHYLLFKTFE